MTPDYLDVRTDVVAEAGRRTSIAADDWQTWGDRIRTAFDHARGEVLDETILGRLETYAGDLERGARLVAADIETLGENTTSAANAVDHADADAAGELDHHGRAGEDRATALRRPINGPVPV